jgi:hypothetical protein
MARVADQAVLAVAHASGTILTLKGRVDLMAQRAVHIESLTTSDVSEPVLMLAEALALASHYSLLAPAGKHVVRCIHAVRELYDFAVEPGQLEFYLGRTGATARHVLSRFRHHWESKEMTAGTVVFRCNTSDVMGWEKAAVRVLLGPWVEGHKRPACDEVAGR